MKTEPIELAAMIDDLHPVSISEDLWGVFFEDINHAADGGLYAELIRNRSFSFSERDAPGWGPLTGWEVHGAVRETDGLPQAAVKPGTPLAARVPAAAPLPRNEGHGGRGCWR